MQLNDGSTDAMRGQPEKFALTRRIGELPRLGRANATDDTEIAGRPGMRLAVDESLGRILGAHEQRGELDRAAVFFTSDHGYFYRGHRLNEARRLAYRESIRVPLLEGREVPWRTSLLAEYYSDTVFPRIANMGYRAVRTGRYKLIRYRELEGMDELYDLDSDPFELRNRIGDERLGEVLRELDAQLLSPARQPAAR